MTKPVCKFCGYGRMLLRSTGGSWVCGSSVACERRWRLVALFESASRRLKELPSVSPLEREIVARDLDAAAVFSRSLTRPDAEEVEARFPGLLAAAAVFSREV